MRSHEDLVAWQLSEKLKDHVYEIIVRPAARSDRDFCDDIRRSARSAPANLSEGFGRYRPRDNARFVRTAIASLIETINHLGHAFKQQIISQDEHRDLVHLAKRAKGATIGYLEYLTSCPPDGPKPRWTHGKNRHETGKPSAREATLSRGAPTAATVQLLWPDSLNSEERKGPISGPFL